MPTRTTRPGGQGPLLDLRSFARPGPAGRVRFSPAQVQQIASTVSRAHEVVVKVSGGATSTAGAIAHLRYIDRNGELAIETDEGEHLQRKGVEKDIAADWDLDSTRAQSRGPYRGKSGRKPARLVHNVILSMPKGTPPEKLLLASRDFAREEFGLKHRYVLTLHTDQAHPHVHLVLKAMSEQGERLNIRKDTLRYWRAEFARHLRTLGVPANATQRYVRGERCPRKSDGIYRTSLRGESTHMHERAESVAWDLSHGGVQIESGKRKLVETHEAVRRAWWTVSEILVRDRQPELATQVRRFVDQMPAPMTEREWFAGKLIERMRTPRPREGPGR